MYRQGKYTRKRGPIERSRQFLKRRYKSWKALPRWKKIAYPSIPLAAFLIIVPAATYAYYYNDIGDKGRLLNRNNTGIVLMDKNNEVFYSSGKAEHRDPVPLTSISNSTKKALIASEDRNFYDHSGFSPLSILRAMYTNIVSRGITGGGSTITQQLAKNTLLTNQQTVLRKYQELTVAMAIEQRYSKDEILDMYLNSVYYGDNSFGIEEAARNYFNKAPADLSLAESAMLVGVLPAPSYYSPVSGNAELAKERQQTVLTRMVRTGAITEAEKTAALAEVLTYAPPQTSTSNVAPHFTEMVRSELYKKYGEEKVERSGYQVKTTLDLNLQKAANESVASRMNYINGRGGSNASLIAIDPKTGDIRAMVGSADYNNAQFGNVNMTTTKRQPGSSFKPIYYTDALSSGKITPATVIRDQRTDFGGYTPQNASRTFYGDVTVRQALNWSLNIPAVKVMQKEGLTNAIDAAKRLGITTLNENSNYGLPLALGSGEVPLDEMTSAYGAFANGGQLNSRSDIKSIENKFGNVIFNENPKSTQAVSEQASYLISNILSDNQTRSRLFGSLLNVSGTDGKVKNVAVKTGTTDDSRDAWTIGYTPEIAIGVWVGNNDNTAMLSGGADMAGPIWRSTMSKAIGTSSPSFTQPAGVVKATVCMDNRKATDVFLSSNVPTRCDTDSNQKQNDQAQTEEQSPSTQIAKCTVAGKQTLNANDPNCKEELCTVTGKENLAANDPNCQSASGGSALDTDSDGVLNTVDQCPNTQTGLSVNTVGCASGQTPQQVNNRSGSSN